MRKQMVQLLRDENTELSSEVVALKATIRELEAGRLCYESLGVTAAEDREAVFFALSVLASRVGRSAVKDRKARTEARKVLESRGITPPSTLGKSRVRVPTKRPPRALSRKRSFIPTKPVIS